MGKWDKKPTQKERRYAILIAFIATLATAIILYVMSLAIPSSPVPISLVFGVSFMFFVPVACYIGVTKYRENVYSATGAFFCLLIIVAIIIVMVGISFSRPP